jgi:hypothetical protein
MVGGTVKTEPGFEPAIDAELYVSHGKNYALDEQSSDGL